MKCPSVSRVLESFALCVSAVALLFTLTIAVNASAILVEQWPVLWRASPPSSAAEPPPASIATPERTAKPRRHHRRAVRPTAAARPSDPAKEIAIDTGSVIPGAQ